MTKRGLTHARLKFLPELAVAALALASGCTGSLEDPGNMGSGAGNSSVPGAGQNGSSGSGGGTGTPGGGSGANAPVGGGGGGTPAGCTGSEVVAPKRLIRLSFNQIANSIRSLLGSAAADKISADFQIGDPTSRTFPPLANPREGSVIESNWPTVDNIAKAAGDYVFANVADVTKCGAAPADACVQQFLNTFAEKAYRRPVTDAEKSSLATVFTQVKAAGGTASEAAQYGVYAIMQAPQFLYRTEFGANPMQEGPLAPYEMASNISYFVTEGPPDAELLTAAQQNALGTTDQISAQVTRLLATDAAKVNLQTAMFAYFSLPALETVVIDAAKAPEFNTGLRNAMYRESELFVNNTLWSGKINDLLTSRRSNINAGLAALYGVQFPPAGVTPGADGFAPVDLPENRSGLLTQAGFLVARSRPDDQSVVGRGLLVNAAILCAENPPFPDALAEQIAAVNESQEDLSERERAEYRGKTAPCSGCHIAFDAYGLALESFDLIGKHRTMDSHGRPIDTSVTLPATAGGTMVKNAVEMSTALAATGTFETCIAKSLISYALAEGAQVTMNSCSTQVVANSFKTSDRSFSAMVREVALSRVFSVRSAGGTQ